PAHVASSGLRDVATYAGGCRGSGARRTRQSGVAVSRAAADRRLGARLIAPAFAVMGLVTAYPLGRAVWLSLFRDRLTDPAGRVFVGLGNYRTILRDPLWWQDVAATAVIVVTSVTLELILGFVVAFALLRVVRGRAPLRTAVLIPYGVVTVVAA